MKLRIACAIVVLGVLLTACADATGPGDGSTTPSPSGVIAHASGAADLVLRVEYQGGFVAPSYSALTIPTFSLFGDGTLVTPGAQIEIYPGPALPAITATSIHEDGVQAILGAALDAGLDHDARYTDMGHVMVADAATTVFTLSVNDHTYRTEVYALGELGGEQPDGMSPDEWTARQALGAFQQDLGTLVSWIPDGSVGDETAYRASAARLLVSDYRPDDMLHQTAVDWPLDVPLSVFGAATPALGADTRCGVLDGQDWDQVGGLASTANQLTPWVSNGARHAIAFRPLLPDESGC